MQKLLSTIVAVTLGVQGAPVRSAHAAAYVPIALRVTPAPASASAAPAAAAPSGEGDTFESLIGQAREKYKEKDYVGAVSFFERAYQLQNEPAILFNIGRAYEEANNIDAAIAYYEKFIADDNVDVALRDKALQRLGALEKIVEIRKREEAKRNPQPDTPKPPTPEVKPNEPPPGPQPPPVTDTPPPPQKNKVLRPLGITMLSLGAGLLLGGGIAGGLTRRHFSEFEAADTLDAQREAGQKGKTSAAIADGFFIAGGVLAAVGIILLLVPKARKNRAAQALRPQVGPGQSGLGYVYRF